MGNYGILDLQQLYLKFLLQNNRKNDETNIVMNLTQLANSSSKRTNTTTTIGYNENPDFLAALPQVPTTTENPRRDSFILKFSKLIRYVP